MATVNRYIVGYLPATLVPALMSFVSVFVFTRLVSTSEYGSFNIAFSAALLGQAACCYALQLGITRLYPRAERDGTVDTFLRTAYAAFVAVVALGMLAGILAIAAWPRLRAELVLGLMAILLFAARASVAINQCVNRAARRVGRLNLIECLHALGGFAFGLVLVLVWQADARALMGGMLAGATISALIDRRLLASAWRPQPVDRGVLAEIGRFAAPLAAVFGASQLLLSADRFLLGALVDASAAGIYTVAFNLVDRPVTLICTSISMATFPHTVRTLEHEGPDAAAEQMVKSGTMLLALSAPGCVGIAMVAAPMATLMVGEAFREGVTQLIPVVAAAAFLRGVSVHFLEHSFHLSKRPWLLLAIYAPAALGSIAVNAVLLPHFGLIGAAWVAVAIQTVISVATLLLGRRQFRYPMPWGQLGRIAVATGTMAAVLRWGSFGADAADLPIAIALGAVSYAAMVLVLDIAGLRGVVMRRLGRTRESAA